MPRDEMPMIGSTTNDETLTELRDAFNLHEHLPNVTKVHVTGIIWRTRTGDGFMVLCAHDEANEAKYHVTYPLKDAKKLAAKDEDPLNEGVKHHVARIVSAAWN